MYLWNTKALAKELKEGTLSESEKFKYYFLTTIFVAVFFEFFLYDEFLFRDLTTVNLSFSLMYVLVTIAGTYLCYEANKQGDGVFFIERMVCLSVPIMIKIFVLCLVFVIISGIILVLIVSEEIYDSLFDFILDVIVLVFIYVGSYYKLYYYLKLVSGADSGNTNS